MLHPGRVPFFVVVIAASVVAPAQDIRFGEERPTAAKAAHVHLLTDSLDVEAGKPQVVELRFRVDEGYHINSHTPKDETLIPTALKLEPAPGLKVLGQEYPKGTAFQLKIGDGATLDVYQGEVRLGLKLVAGRGDAVLTGTFRYQACDSSSCFPPRTLPVRVALRAK